MLSESKRINQLVFSQKKSQKTYGYLTILGRVEVN